MAKPAKNQGNAPFSRDEIIHEVRRAAVGMASHLSMWGHRQNSPELAADYLGVHLESYHYQDIGDRELDSIPIEEHFLYTVVMDAYDHAYQCGEIIDDQFTLDERHYEIAGLISGFPSTDFHGEPTPFERLNPQKLRQVLETFLARYWLDKGEDLNVFQLALLAGMGEAAVRTSLSAEKIKTVSSPKKDDKKVHIANADAKAWLAGRRAFVPTRSFGVTGDAEHDGMISGIFSANGIAFEVALQRALEMVRGDAERQEQLKEFPPNWLDGLISSDELIAPDVMRLERLAEILGTPVASFVGRAVTALLMRRERVKHAAKLA